MLSKRHAEAGGWVTNTPSIWPNHVRHTWTKYPPRALTRAAFHLAGGRLIHRLPTEIWRATEQEATVSLAAPQPTDASRSSHLWRHTPESLHLLTSLWAQEQPTLVVTLSLAVLMERTCQSSHQSPHLHRHDHSTGDGIDPGSRASPPPPTKKITPPSASRLRQRIVMVSGLKRGQEWAVSHFRARVCPFSRRRLTTP